MLQGQVGRLIEFPLTGLFGYCFLQDRNERGICQGIDEVSTVVFLATPFGSVFNAVGNAFAYDAFIELAVLKFDEEPRYTGFAIREIFSGKVFLMENIEEMVANFLHSVECVGTNLTHLTHIAA